MVDFIDMRKNFPDAQKLFRWQCHHETWVLLTQVNGGSAESCIFGGSGGLSESNVSGESGNSGESC